MNLLVVGIIYGVAVLVAIVISIVQIRDIRKRSKPPVCPVVDNYGKPICGGVKYVKIICR